MTGRRHSIRLPGYDYSRAGAYFVTICTYDRKCLLGDVENGQMRMSDAGRIVQATWEALPDHYPHVQLDAWVVMPNHVHAVIVIGAPPVSAMPVGAGLKPAPSQPSPASTGAGLKPAPTVTAPHEGPSRHGLPEVVRALKTFSARRINEFCNTPGVPVWQRNYFEHVIRNDKSLARIREYIAANPANWVQDSENPTSRVGSDYESEIRQLLREVTT